MNPRVRPCEPLCGLLRGGAASLPRGGISSRFRTDFRGFPRLFGGRRKKQDKRLASLPTPDIFSTAWNGRRICRRPTFCYLPHGCSTTWAASSETMCRVPPLPQASRSTTNAYSACAKRKWPWDTSGTTMRMSRTTAWAVWACKQRKTCVTVTKEKWKRSCYNFLDDVCFYTASTSGF